jgi:Cd2+/Zn2+-exporting ATPase
MVTKIAEPAVRDAKIRVEGMDCSSCAIKIENALQRLPGVGKLRVNYATETVSLQFDDSRTSWDRIEDQIRRLGYRPFALSGADKSVAKAEQKEAGPWWSTPQGHNTIGLGVLLALAFAVSTVRPETAPWVYGIAAVIGLTPFARRAFAAARTGTPFSIETLMTVAAAGAVAIGAAEEAVVVIFLFAVGELLETVAAGQARAGIKALMNVVPRKAWRESDGKIVEVPADELQIGDVVLVRPGDRMPSDGEVIEGQSAVDQAPITGESAPVGKNVGDRVFAGSINSNGSLRVRITHTAADNTISRIIHLVEEAQGSKAPTARFIDRFSRYYTPAAMAAAGLITILPPLLFEADWQTWIYRGLATLLIACPCALVISTPAAIASALAGGARRGILVKGGAALETIGKVRTIAFDKTGTLTVGCPKVTDVVALETSENEILAKAAAVERGSNHPLDLAVIAEAESRDLTIPQAFGSTAVPGKAVTARLRDGFVAIGSPRYASETASLVTDVSARIEALERDGKTVVVVLGAGRAIGLIALRDEPRDDAAEGIRRLGRLGVRTMMLTGDNRLTAHAIGERLGLDVQSELLPSDKLAYIGELRQQGPVAMVGDGINDAPALAAADVGVAMGGGTDVALETADAALLRNRVLGIAELVELSRATLANVWQNITVALGLKAVFLLTTLLGMTSLWMAILADTGATVLVTANALRLLRA